jgi:DNA-binding CsgD family transcriptional regulator
VAEKAAGQGGRRVWALAAIVLLQAVAAAFFVGDALIDVRGDGWDAHVAVEGGIALALVAGVVLGALVLRRMLAEARRSADALAVARGAMGALVAERFAEWGLTAAEADVALFALKGFDTGGIAELRGAAPGTVRAQLAQVYAKAGVSSRAGLVALFFEDLLEGL